MGIYAGGVLAPSGDIHFIPFLATVGQKISSAGVVSTYSLIYSEILPTLTPTAVASTFTSFNSTWTANCVW